MLQKFKRIVVICVMLLSFAVNSFAVIPVVIPVVAATLIVATAAGLYYNLKPAPATVNASGTIIHPALLTWAAFLGNTVNIFNKDLNAIMSNDAARDLASGKDANGNWLYPSMHGVYNNDDVHGLLTAHAGAYLDAGPYGKWILADLFYTTGQSCFTAGTLPKLVVIAGGVEIQKPEASSYCSSIGAEGGRGYRYHATSTNAPPPAVPKTLAEANIELSNSIQGGNIADQYQEEIDKMYQDPDYVPVFSDGSDGISSAPPTNALTPEQLRKYNESAEAAAASAASARAAANTAAINAAALQQAATAAQAAADAATAVAAQNPTADNQRAADAAVAAAAAAKAAATQAATTAAQAEATATKTEADAAKEEAPMPTNDPPGKRKGFNFDKWKALKDIMLNVGPFAFLGAMGHYFDNLVQSPQAPSFDIPIWGDFKFHVDLSVFDPIAAAFRYILSAILAVGCTMYIVEFWRGK